MADVILPKKLLPGWQGMGTFQLGEGGWLPLGRIRPADSGLAPLAGEE